MQPSLLYIQPKGFCRAQSGSSTTAIKYLRSSGWQHVQKRILTSTTRRVRNPQTAQPKLNHSKGCSGGTRHKSSPFGRLRSSYIRLKGELRVPLRLPPGADAAIRLSGLGIGIVRGGTFLAPLRSGIGNKCI